MAHEYYESSFINLMNCSKFEILLQKDNADA